MQPNNIRFDLSDQLIHFFRDVDLNSERPTDSVEDFGENNLVMDGSGRWPALFLLRCAVRSRRLWATWSIRNNKRGVFGPRPAVCFSEMPLAAFLESSRQRESRGQAMSGYALTFPKEGIFDLGARPAIYGLSDTRINVPPGVPGKPRLLSPTDLPLLEQYRYVPYNPLADPAVDWLHEREWRWPCSSDLTAYQDFLDDVGHIPTAADMPHLSIAVPQTKGMGIIVKTLDEGGKLAHDVLTLVDQGELWPSDFEYVLVRDQLPATEQLYSPKQVQNALQAATLDIKSFLKVEAANARKDADDFARRATAVEDGAGKVRRENGGGCWLWFTNNTDGYVRSLVAAKRIFVNAHGKYLADLREFDGARSREQRQAMAEVLAGKLRAPLGVQCQYYSVLDGYDPDSVAYAHEDTLDNDLYFNLSDYETPK